MIRKESHVLQINPNIDYFKISDSLLLTGPHFYTEIIVGTCWGCVIMNFSSVLHTKTQNPWLMWLTYKLIKIFLMCLSLAILSNLRPDLVFGTYNQNQNERNL